VSQAVRRGRALLAGRKKGDRKVKGEGMSPLVNAGGGVEADSKTGKKNLTSDEGRKKNSSEEP